MRPTEREGASSARETNCMILLLGVGLITGAVVFLAPDMPMPGILGMAMAFGLIGVPALAPLLGYVLYSLLHLPPPAPRLTVVLPALLVAGGSVFAACRLDLASYVPLDEKFAPLVVYAAVAAANGLIVWLGWKMTRPETT